MNTPIVSYILNEDECCLFALVPPTNPCRYYLSMYGNDSFISYAKKYGIFEENSNYVFVFPDGMLEYHSCIDDELVLHNERGPALCKENHIEFYLRGDLYDVKTYFKKLKNEYDIPEDELLLLKLKYQ